MKSIFSVFVLLMCMASGAQAWITVAELGQSPRDIRPITDEALLRCSYRLQLLEGKNVKAILYPYRVDMDYRIADLSLRVLAFIWDRKYAGDSGEVSVFELTILDGKVIRQTYVNPPSRGVGGFDMQLQSKCN